MSRGESDAHVRLKQLALDWARAAGWSEVAVEVRVPRSGFRADVVALNADASCAVVFECKQSRADFLKDAHAEAFVRTRLAELAERQRALEEMLSVHRPELRRGEAFWPECDTWNFESLEHRTYQRVLQEQAMLRRRVREGTKFARMVRYACADRLYLVTEPDIYAAVEIPHGWGVLVRAGESLEVWREAPVLATPPAQRQALAWAVCQTRRRRAGLAPETPPEPALLQFELSV